MGLFDFFRSGDDEVARLINNDDTIQDLNEGCSPIIQLAYQKLAIEMCIDLIANYVARTDWRYYKKGKRTVNQIESLLNLSPNPIETSNEFFKHFTYQLLWNQDVLLLTDTNRLYVADDYELTMPTFDTIYFTSVSIFGKAMPKARYRSNEAFRLVLHNRELMSLLKRFQKQYGGLIQSSVDGYQSNRTKRYIMTNPMYRSQGTDVQEKFNKMLETNLRSFANGTGKASVYSKPENVSIEDFSDSQIASASDSRNMIADIFNRTANAFHVPPAYLYGENITEAQLQAFIRDAVLPVVDLFEQGFNKFQFSEYSFRTGERVKADTTKLTMVDLNTIGNFIKNVLPTGAITLGDVAERYLQADSLPEELSDLRLITKNYAKVDDFLNSDTTATNNTVTNEDETVNTSENEDENNNTNNEVVEQ